MRITLAAKTTKPKAPAQRAAAEKSAMDFVMRDMMR
jgi:hypothetical protein